MKNVIKPSEAVYLDEEVVIGSRDPQSTLSHGDTTAQSTAQHYQEDVAEGVVDYKPQPDSDVGTAQQLSDDSDTAVQSHTVADSYKSTNPSQPPSSLDDNSDTSLEFMRDDEPVGVTQSTTQALSDSVADDLPLAMSLNPDVTVDGDSIHSDSADSVNTLSNENIQPQSINLQPDNDIPEGKSSSAVVGSSATHSPHSTPVSALVNHPPASHSSSSQSPTEDMLTALATKIEDIHSMVVSLHKTSPDSVDINTESELLTRIASIEKLLEASDAAQNTGYEVGYKAGYQEAMEKGSDEIKSAIHNVRKISGELLSRKNEIIHESQDAIIDLIVLIAQKVVKQISKENKDVVVSNVKDALSKVKKHSHITIRINPTDLEVNETILKTISHEIAIDSEIEFVEDTTIDNGGVYIETESSSVNAQISAQLLEIENSIRDMR